MASNTPITDHRAERILAFMVAALVLLSIAAFLAIIIGTAVGVRNFGEGVWPVMIFAPQIALPLGLILMVTLLVVSGARRSRENRDSANSGRESRNARK